MGTYLATGIVESIGIRKKDIPSKVTTEAIFNALRKEVNVDNYSYSEDDHCLYWTIKPTMLEGSFLEFLEVQLKIYDEEGWEEDLQPLRKAQTGQERLNLAQANSVRHFQLIENIYDSLRVREDNNFETRIIIVYNLIAFFIDGKIIMESYKKSLNYFIQNIRLQNQQYPISQCFQIMITS